MEALKNVKQLRDLTGLKHLTIKEDQLHVGKLWNGHALVYVNAGNDIATVLNNVDPNGESLKHRADEVPQREQDKEKYEKKRYERYEKHLSGDVLALATALDSLLTSNGFLPVGLCERPDGHYKVEWTNGQTLLTFNFRTH